MVEKQRYIILLPGEGQRSPTKSLCAPENLVLDGGTAVIAIDVDDPDLDRCQVRTLPRSSLAWPVLASASLHR